MIESFVTQNMIARGETAVADYLRTGQTDYTKLLNESWTEVMRDLINRNFDIKLLCNRLVLQDAVTKTDVFDGAITDEDFANRMRLVITVTNMTDPGIAVFTLQGTDDEGVTYSDVVVINDTDSSDSAITITAIGVTSYILMKQYNKYRLKLTTSPATITYSSFMIEDIYTELHLRKTRENIYRSLISAQNDDYDYKRGIYEMSYNKLLEIGKMPYDVDESGTIEEDEGSRVSSNIVFRA